MGEINGYSGLEAALLLATEREKEIFRRAFDGQDADKRAELAAKGTFLAYEKRESGIFTVYEFADETEIYIIPSEPGTVAAQASFPTGPINKVGNVRYTTGEHHQQDAFPEDTGLGYSKMLTIAKDLGKKEPLHVERYKSPGSLQHAFVTEPRGQHALLNKFLLLQIGPCGYMEVSGLRRVFIPSETPSRDVSNFYSGILAHFGGFAQ